MPQLTVKDRLEELRRRREEALAAGGEEAIEKQHSKGKKTARERIELLLDPDSFVETDMFVVHRATGFGIEEEHPPGDAVITGYGTIDDRPVCVFSQDFTVFGGSLGEVVGEKIVKIMETAMRMGCPIIGLNDSGGARIQEGVTSLAGYGEIFYRNVLASGVVPQISAVMGPCAGGAVYSPAIMDFVFMVQDTAHMFITGPNVIEMVTGEEVSMEELGGAAAHSKKSGVAHFVADDEESCLEDLKYLLSFLPSNNLESPPHVDLDDDPFREIPDLDTFIPDSPNQPYDMRDVVSMIVDAEQFFEVHQQFAENLIVGFARLDGHTVGVIGNQPKHLAGTLDIDSAVKGARFVRFCDAFNIPILTFADVPGFLPGVEQEHAGIIRHGAKLLYAMAEATVPKLTVITRKVYGGAYDVMGSKHLGADINLAWPTAEVAVMGPKGAVNILYKDELKEADDPEARREELEDQYHGELANPWTAAEHGFLDAVIEPSQSRIELIKGLRLALTKRVKLPPKKHGNIPL